jgi:DNA-binding response OmpR family regulator
MSKKILVIDDDEGILDALELMLDTAGYKVETSPDGAVLKKLNEDNLPNLILLDVLLSGEDGRELCKILKNKEHTKKVPVLMISADPATKVGAKLCGADDFLAKPFEMNELLKKVEKFTN